MAAKPSTDITTKSDVTAGDIAAFVQRINEQARDTDARSDDVRHVIIQRLLSANNLEDILAAGDLALPSMEDLTGVPVRIMDFALVRSAYETSDAYAVVDLVTRDGEKIIAAWGGVSVVDTLVRLREVDLIPTTMFVKLDTRTTSAGYQVYKLVACK